MISDLQHASLIEAFIHAVQKARQEHTSKLVSITEAFTDHPLQFYANGEQLNLDFRQLWSDPEGLTVVGIGTSKVFEADGESRFDQIKSQWTTFIEKHVIEGKTAPGLMLMGGFSFNKKSPEGSEWRNFPSGAMVLPRFVLTQKDEQCQLTVNVLVKPEDDPHTLADHVLEHKNILKSEPPKEHSGGPGELQRLTVESKNGLQWKEAVQKAVDKINHGVLDKIVLSRSLHVKASTPFNIPHILQRLRVQQPSAFVFAIERNGRTFLGATPERLVKKEGQYFYADALAGTAPRSKDKTIDENLGSQLLNDKKNREEHQFVVQMIKSTLAEMCDSQVVPDQPVLLKTRDVQHLYTPISGKSKPNAHLLDAVKNMHPTPAMGGTPREKALELISELETYERGWYSAPIGWMDGQGNGDFSAAIRSGLIHDNEAFLFAGCGVVGDSSPEAEYKETEIKFRPMLNALGGE